MQGQSFTGQYPISIIALLARFKKACNQNALPEGLANWFFQFFLDWSAYATLQYRLTGDAMAMEVHKSEMLRPYPEVVNHLLKTYITDEVISEAHSDITRFHQASSKTEMEYSTQLWEKALRCGIVFSHRRHKSLFADGLLPTTRPLIRNYFSANLLLDYQSVARYAQAIGESYRASKISLDLIPAKVVGRISFPEDGSLQKGLFHIGNRKQDFGRS